MEERQLDIMRQMAWERAKGELRSILATYTNAERGKLNDMEVVLTTFISDVEDKSLHECKKS